MIPLVTIGIPTYNVGSFVSLSIESVLAQTYTNFELIITDDGSTDNTVDEIRKFNDPRIKLIVSSENHGISYCLNKQIDMAKGDIFVRMDGDDLMFPTRVEEQVRFLQEHPDTDVVGAGAVVIDDENNIIGQRQNKKTIRRPEDVINNTPFIHPTVCGRIGFFRKYHYEERLCGVEDNDLWLRGIIESKYAIIPQPLIFYRDPLKFKLKTYTMRQMKGCKEVFMRWSIFKDKLPAIRYIIMAFAKSFAAILYSILGKDEKFIARRNTVNENTLSYQSILDTLIYRHTLLSGKSSGRLL